QGRDQGERRGGPCQRSRALTLFPSVSTSGGTMGKWLGAVAVAAVVALGGPVARPAAADDMNMNGGATCAPDGTSLTLTAQDHAFDKNCLAVPAGQPFTIRFDNRDADRHNVAILPSHMSTDAFFRGDIVSGPKSITYSVPALKAGTSAGDGSGGRHARPHADPDHGVGSPERGGVRSGARTGARRPGREIRRRGTEAHPRAARGAHRRRRRRQPPAPHRPGLRPAPASP